tara:strand:- start:47 stop:256 length:210 start_codon:yes stop_codon:yes gene_type:complete
MKRLLLPLLAALALPAAVNAESVWLVIAYGNVGMEKIEMKDLDQCIEQGEKLKQKQKLLRHQYFCIEGK